MPVTNTGFVESDSGADLFIEQRLNSSKYIRGVSMTAVTGEVTVTVKPVPFLTALSGGKNDGTIDNTGAVSSSEFVTALEDLTDSVQYPISYLLDGGLTFPDYQIALISLATQREDCIAILSTPQRLEYDSNPGRSIVEYVQQNLPSTSFGAVFTPWQLATDTTAGNRDIMVPPDGYVAGQMSRVDSTKGPWEAAAGTENGAIRSRGGALRFNQADLDNLYANRINPIIQIQGGGPTIWGNVTLLSTQAPLSRINVRKLINKIQTELRVALLPFVQAPITSRTYEQIFSLVDAYLSSIQLRGGLKDRKVVCDASNNSNEDADNQIINVWIYIKPTTVAEFINLTSIVTPNSVSFDAIDVTAV